jgi:dipeptidyl aminopeptidase/acylaminoacyl peptidase
MRLIAVALLLATATAIPSFAADAPPPDALETSVARMARIGSASGGVYSPDGTQIAFITALSGVPQVWVIPAAGGYPRQVTASDDPVGGVGWSRDGDWLAVSILPGGGLNSQIHLVRPDGTGMERITAGGGSNNNLGGFDDDGLLLYASNERDPAASDGWLYDLSDRSKRLAMRNEGVGALTDVTADGRYALGAATPERGRTESVLVDLREGTQRVLSNHGGPGQESARFSRDGRTIWFTSNRGSDRSGLARASFEDGKVGDFEWIARRDDAELSARFDRAGRRALLNWNVAGRSELELLDVASGKREALSPPPSEVASVEEFSPDDRFVLFSVNGATAPNDLWRYEIATREWTRLTFSPHPGVDLSAMVRPRLETYKAHDGLGLSGWLYLPPGFEAPGPVVLSFHGGPEGQERPVFRADYQALLSRGIAVFAPNIRGSSGFGKRFVNLDNGALRVDANRDIRSTAEHLVAAGIADRKRIGITGGSYGGYAVMVGLTEFPDLFAAGANLFGMVNFETFFKHTQPWMAKVSASEYGDPVTDAKLLRDLSPIHKIDRIRAPTLVLHGANDTNVPVIEAEQIVEELRRREVPVAYVLFPDEGHGWRKTANRIRSTVEIVKFFEQYLVGDAAAPPAAAASAP